MQTRLPAAALLVILLAFALVLPLYAATQNTLDSDDFDMGAPANGTQLNVYRPGVWTNTGITNNNNAAIRGMPGVGAISVTSADLNVGFTWTANQWAQFTVDGTTACGGLRCMVLLRAAGDGSNRVNGYGCGNNITGLDNKYRIFEFVADTPTSIAGPGATVSVNDVINCQVVGNTISLTVTGTGATSLSVSRSTYATGNVGLMLWDVGTVRLAGSWRAGSVTGTTGGGGLSMMDIGK